MLACTCAYHLPFCIPALCSDLWHAHQTNNVKKKGSFFLLIMDFVHVTEYVMIRPFYYLFMAKEFRTISFEEKGYWILRRVTEVFAESIPQALLQLYILLRIRGNERNDLDIDEFTVGLSLLSSCLVLAFWVAVLFFESGAHGLSFVEYVTVVFQVIACPSSLFLFVVVARCSVVFNTLQTKW